MLNLPNLLTLGRFFLIPIYFFTFFSTLSYKNELSFLVLLFAGCTDMIDGYLARKYQWTTPIGIILDPLADKCLIISVLASFVISELISWQAATILVIRDLGLILGAAFLQYRKQKPIPANIYGKVSTFLFYTSFLLILIRFPGGELFLWSAISFSLFTSLVYANSLKKRIQLQYEP